MIAGQKVTGQQLDALKKVLDDVEKRLVSGWFHPNPVVYVETVADHSIDYLLTDEPHYPVADRPDPPERTKCHACALGGLLLGTLGARRRAVEEAGMLEVLLYRSYINDQALVLSTLHRVTGLNVLVLRLIERAFCAEYGTLPSSFVGSATVFEEAPRSDIRKVDHWFHEEAEDGVEEREFASDDRMKVIIQALREGEGTVNFDEDPHSLLDRWNQAHAAQP